MNLPLGPSLALILAVTGTATSIDTLVRVVGANGEGLKNADVFFFAAPLRDVPGAACIYHNRLVRQQTDAWGRTRVKLDTRCSWSMWAVKDDGSIRLASHLIPNIQVGRAQRVCCYPWQVRTFRWTGLHESYRDTKPLKTLFVSSLLALDGLASSLDRRLACVPILTCARGTAPEQTMRLPLLPLGTYGVLLTIGGRQILEDRGGEPSFESLAHQNWAKVRQGALSLAAKGCATVHLRVTDSSGSLVKHAIVYVRPMISCDLFEERYRSDESGQLGVPVGLRESKSVYVWMPDYVPTYFRLEAGQKGRRELRIRKGRQVTWTVRSARPEDLEQQRFFLRTSFACEGRGSPEVALPIACSSEGRLLVPAPDNVMQSGARVWQLYLLRQGCPVLLYDHKRGKVPDHLSIDLSRLREVSIKVAMRGGSLLRDPTAKLVHGRYERFCPIDRNGIARVSMMPGDYKFIVVSDRGDGLLKFGISDDAEHKRELRLQLTPYRLVRGRVTDEDGKPVRSATVLSMRSTDRGFLTSNPAPPLPSPGSVAPYEVQRLRRQKKIFAVTDCFGEFEIWLPQNDAETYVWAEASAGASRARVSRPMQVRPWTGQDLQLHVGGR